MIIAWQARELHNKMKKPCPTQPIEPYPTQPNPNPSEPYPIQPTNIRVPLKQERSAMFSYISIFCSNLSMWRAAILLFIHARSHMLFCEDQKAGRRSVRIPTEGC